MSTRIEISKDEPLQVDDIIELHFKCSGPGWWKATLAAMIESQLKSNEKFFIKSIDYLTDGELIFTCVVLKTNPVIVTVVVIAALIIAASVAVWLTLDKAYKIVETPAGQVGSIGLIIIALLMAYYFFIRRRSS
jgi:hypothetical protein